MPIGFSDSPEPKGPGDLRDLFAAARNTSVVKVTSFEPPLLAVANFHHSGSSYDWDEPLGGAKSDRRRALDALARSGAVYFDTPRRPKDAWAVRSQGFEDRGSATVFHFEVCPEGNGPDTHRIYEALVLGLVPVVCSSPRALAMSSLFPILVLGSWEELPSAMSSDASIATAQKVVQPAPRLHSFLRLSVEWWEEATLEIKRGLAV